MSLEEINCCAHPQWNPIKDLGHTDGCDFDMGQCKLCDTYWMFIWMPSTTGYYTKLSLDEANQFLNGTASDQKKRVSDWFNKN